MPLCVCRLERTNVIIVSQPRYSGYQYDWATQQWEKVDGQRAWANGSGYSMCQMSWVQEGFIVSSEGVAEPLVNTNVFELLEKRNIL